MPPITPAPPTSLIPSHLSLPPSPPRRRLIVPHRLMPYPEPVLTLHHKREQNSVDRPLDWLDFSCCMQRHNCYDRKVCDYVSL